MTARRAIADARGGDPAAVRGTLFRHVRMTLERRAKPRQIAAAWGRVGDRAAALRALFRAGEG
jgi:methylphosphotriester-DNA--protein-cysteine methyltransferase